jgi:hypothetical protein
MTFGKRDAEAVREDLLCAYLVLRELRDHAPHYSGEARNEMVDKATSALRKAWADTGADVKEMEPKMMAMLASGQICGNN